MEKEIKNLEYQFTGTGEVKGFIFTKFKENNSAYIYKVVGDGGNVYFEVFERKNTPVCIDFEKRIYSDTEFKEVYPKSNDFGVWAYTFNDMNKAIKKALEINYELQSKIESVN